MNKHKSRTEAFVDAIDHGTVRVIVGGRAFSLPTEVLPAGATEGQWIEWTTRIIPPPPATAKAEEERRRLSADDDGGDIKL